MKQHHKCVMKNKKNSNLNTQIERYFVIQIRASIKMQKIVEQRSPSRQLFETVNFAFMKILDFLVKIAIFRVFLLFLRDSRHAFLPGSNVRLRPCAQQCHNWFRQRQSKSSKIITLGLPTKIEILGILLHTDHSELQLSQVLTIKYSTAPKMSIGTLGSGGNPRI